MCYAEQKKGLQTRELTQSQLGLFLDGKWADNIWISLYWSYSGIKLIQITKSQVRKFQYHPYGGYLASLSPENIASAFPFFIATWFNVDSIFEVACGASALIF